jgi:hypothetical protein
MAKEMKSHTIAESVILRACRKIINIMFSEGYEEKILKIPVLDNTISQSIRGMFQDFESQASINKADFFAIQLDESTDITGKGQLLEFSRFVCNGNIIEQFLFCKPLLETTKGQDILDVHSCFSSPDLS